MLDQTGQHVLGTLADDGVSVRGRQRLARPTVPVSCLNGKSARNCERSGRQTYQSDGAEGQDRTVDTRFFRRTN